MLAWRGVSVPRDVLTPAPPSGSVSKEGVVLRSDFPTPSLANTLFNQRAVETVREPLATLEVLNEGPSKLSAMRFARPLPRSAGGRDDVRLTDERQRDAREARTPRRRLVRGGHERRMEPTPADRESAASAVSKCGIPDVRLAA